MQRLLSTYIFISKKLTPEMLGQIAEAGFQGIEIFCTRSHFEYTMKPEIHAMAGALEAQRLQLVSLHAPTSRVCVENTLSEMGDPTYLRAFVDETRLSGLRFNFDIGHAHLAELPQDERLEKSFSPLRDFVSSVHLHDNHGEKDEHLPPYDGSIDWPSAVKTLQSAPQTSLPLVLELKEKTGHEAPTVAEQLAAARASLNRFEKAWSS